MKKRSVIVAMLCSMCLAVSTPIPAMADASKVVTLGADLTDEQKNTMMNYFKADASQVQVISVTNQDELDLLGKYIPSEQIGTRTLSCAYVKPTQSGGIKVRTANLNYVSCNMIATALSTAGVTNCEVVAACPYEVSGTGALTGVMKAYESASGQELDSTKKDLAAKEVVVTGDVAQQVGQDNATNIINQAKMQIIGDNIQNADEIYNIVYNIAEQNGVSLSQDEIDTIVSLLQQIAQQNYDIQSIFCRSICVFVCSFCGTICIFCCSICRSICIFSASILCCCWDFFTAAVICTAVCAFLRCVFCSSI